MTLDFYRSWMCAASLAAVVAAPLAAGQSELWHVPYPSATVSGTSYSRVYGGSFPKDTEVADDFQATGLINEIIAPGRGCGQCSPPIVDGVFVRVYEWTSSGPGALQHERYIDASDPDFTWDGVYPFTLYITLDDPIPVDGWHFMSIQVAFGAGGGVWNFVQANRFNEINATVQFRDNLDGGVWEQDYVAGSFVQADVALTLLGEAAPSTPVVESVSRTTVTGSDRIMVNGSSFGAPGDGELLVDGLPAIVTSWSTTQIIGYVPEGVEPGPATLTVTNLGESSEGASINVTPREPNGRIAWVFEGDGDYATFAPTTGPDGTVYFQDIDANLYAMSPDGALLWLVDALNGEPGNGDEGRVAVGSDGTIYVPVNPLGPGVHLTAFNPDGSHKWTYDVNPALTWQAGPTIGPDGKIYGAMNAAQLLGNSVDVFALNPDGSEAWSTAANPFVFEDAAPGSDIVFGPSSPGGPLDQFMFTADRNGDGRNWGFDLDGDQDFATPTAGGNDVGQTQLVSNVVSGDFYMMEFGGIGGAGWGLQSFGPDGERGWRFDPGIASGATHPAIDDDGAIYFGWDGLRLTKVDASGSHVWTHVRDSGGYDTPAPSPTAPTVFAAGFIPSFGPAFMELRSSDDARLLWEQIVVDDEGDDVAAYTDPRWTPDGQTIHFAALELPITPTSTFRVFAINAGDDEPGDPADLDGDGAVNAPDLAALLAAWGPCGDCPADLTGDGVVNAADLAALLAAWTG